VPRLRIGNVRLPVEMGAGAGAAREAARSVGAEALTTGRVVAGVGVIGAVAYAWNRWSDAALKRLETASSSQATGELR
jgi:hypothetical protein